MGNTGAESPESGRSGAEGGGGSAAVLRFRRFQPLSISGFQRFQEKLTFGASRWAASSIWNSWAARKPNRPAKITLGKVSRVVL